MPGIKANPALRRGPYRGRPFRSQLATNALDVYGTAVLADSPNSWYRLGESAGAFVDSIAARNGTVVGSPTRAAPSLLGTGFDAALNCNALGAVDVNPYNVTASDTFTLEAFVSWVSGGATIADRGSNMWRLYVNANGTIGLDKSNVATIVTSTSSLTSGTAAHVVATKTGAAVKLYINGVDVTGVVTDATMAANWDQIGIGVARGGVAYANAVVDEFATYPTALTAARVLAHYNASLAAVAAAAVVFDPANGFDWSEQPAAWAQAPWYQPDTEAWTPLPNLTVAPTDQQAPLWLEQPGQEAPVIAFWYSPEEAHAPPIILAILPLDPSLTGDLWHDHSHQQARSIAPTWFAPDASIEGLVPPTAVVFDPATGFDWSDQPATWQQPPWFTPDDTGTPFQPTAAVFDPATGFPWLEQPQDWIDGTPFVQRDIDDVDGFPPLPNAYAGADLGWDATFDRSIAPTWHAPDASIDSFPPLPNAATHPDLGWDATFDRDQTVVWFGPDASIESPLPLASPLTPLTPDLIAGLWPDQSGQQDSSIQPVWFAPDASFEPPSFPIFPAAPTSATVDQQAALWPEQPAAWQDWRNITDAIEAQAFTLNINLYAPAPGATPKVLINAENGDVFLYIGGGFIVPAS